MPKGDTFERMVEKESWCAENPGDHEPDYVVDSSTAIKLLRAQHRAYVKVVEDEEEFDGPISETVWAELTKSRKSAARVVRLAVFATKKSILTKLNARGK